MPALRFPDASRSARWTVPKTGEVFAGKYRVQRVLGRGALAEVVLATHVRLEQSVALKILLPEWAGHAEVEERFLREARAATRIRSEHVARVFDVVTDEGTAPHLVLEYLDGQDLDDVLASRGPLPVRTAVEYLLQASEALAEAHMHGIVHRDLKPSNLYLTHRADGSECVKVLDFGISHVEGPRELRLTDPKALMGSPYYMAPEQIHSPRSVDARADVWALGAILYELVSGVPPFTAPSLPELYRLVVEEEPPPLAQVHPSVPLELEAAIRGALTKDAGRRFHDVGAFARAIAPFGGAAGQESAERIVRVLARGSSHPARSRASREADNTPDGRVLAGGVAVEGDVLSRVSAPRLRGTVPDPAASTHDDDLGDGDDDDDDDDEGWLNGITPVAVRATSVRSVSVAREVARRGPVEAPRTLPAAQPRRRRVVGPLALGALIGGTVALGLALALGPASFRDRARALVSDWMVRVQQIATGRLDVTGEPLSIERPPFAADARPKPVPSATAALPAPRPLPKPTQPAPPRAKPAAPAKVSPTRPALHREDAHRTRRDESLFEDRK
jgi:serine/threonine-protein kinase